MAENPDFQTYQAKIFLQKEFHETIKLVQKSKQTNFIPQIVFQRRRQKWSGQHIYNLQKAINISTLKLGDCVKAWSLRT